MPVPVAEHGKSDVSTSGHTMSLPGATWPPSLNIFYRPDRLQPRSSRISSLWSHSPNRPFGSNNNHNSRSMQFLLPINSILFTYSHSHVRTPKFWSHPNASWPKCIIPEPLKMPYRKPWRNPSLIYRPPHIPHSEPWDPSRDRLVEGPE